MMHATSDSDITSIGPSSASPRAYYVESPSCDSHDDIDKCSSNGPCPSPSEPRHSMTSSSSTAISRIFGNRRRWNKHYCNVVVEEGGGGGGGGGCDDDYYGDRGYHRQCNSMIIMIMAFVLVFAGICLVVSSAGRHYKAQVSMERLRIQNVYFGEGSDRTGVPTKLMTVNCSAGLLVYNPATFFGIHVSSNAANLIYSQITVATGQLKKYYQPRKSRRIMWVRLVGREVPLYGAGVALAASDRSEGIPFRLEFEIQSRGNLLGKLLKTKHAIHFSCSLLVNSKRTKQVVFKKNSCKYL